MKSKRYSSNFTLFYVIFLPIFWMVLFGAAVIGFFIIPLFSDEVDDIGFTKYIYLFLLIIGICYYLLVARRLKRVDGGEEYLYVTNYFKTVRIPLPLVEKIRFYDLYILRIAKITLVQKGLFGQDIFILERENQFEEYAIKQKLPTANLTHTTRKMQEKNQQTGSSGV